MMDSVLVESPSSGFWGSLFFMFMYLILRNETRFNKIEKAVVAIKKDVQYIKQLIDNDCVSDD